MFMPILRRIGLWFASTTFRFLLLMTAVAATVVMVFGTTVHIKQVLRNSNVYGSFTDGIIEELKKNPETQNDSSLPIDDPVFQKAIKTAFTPEFLQSTSENIIDGTYNWLSNKVSQPDFKIDISTQKQQFANAMGDYAVTKLNTLPVCTRQQLLQISGDIDPFKATCRPASLDANAQKQKVINELMTSPHFLNKTVITADSLSKTDGKTIFQQHTEVPKAYSWFSMSPMLLMLILMLLAASVVFIHETKRRGLRTIGLILAESGVFLVVASFVSKWMYQSASKPGGAISKAMGNTSFEPTISKLLRGITDLINSRLMWIGIAYAFIGLVILVILFITRPKKNAKSRPAHHSVVHEPTNLDEESPEHDSATAEATPGSEPRKPDTKPKIQG